MSTQPIYRQDAKPNPLISFIIPVYNIPTEMLTECLDSIFALSLSDSEREVILIDDGSSVSPINDILNYLDKIVYLRQKNQGVSVARNIGLELAKGDFIQFVDGDDCLLTSAYEHCLDMIRYKDADMVLFRFIEGKTTEPVKTAIMNFDGPVSGHDYMRHNNLRATPCGYIFKRRILGSLQFHKGIDYGEDEEFTPQLLLRAEKIYFTASPAYFYRNRATSATHQHSSRRKLKRLNDAVDVILTLRNRADVLPYNDRQALQRRIDQLTMDYIYNVIVLTRSGHYLEKCISNLHGKGLFPLPDRAYTKKYKYFRRLVNSKVGRKILLAMLPKIH